MKKWRDGQSLPVEAWAREMKKKLATGKLLTIDNTIDPGTGTARFKAEFPNEDSSLFPNQFVNARLLLDTKRDTTVVPVAAIQRSPQGTFVFILKEDKTVTVRPVKVGPGEADLISVDEGLAPGDIVVVEGAEKLREGSKVELPATEQGDKASRKNRQK
jgi:multidrug efflux system membrane fusion protein